MFLHAARVKAGLCGVMRYNTEIRPRGARGLVTTEIEMSEYKSMFEQAVRTLAAIDRPVRP